MIIKLTNRTFVHALNIIDISLINSAKFLNDFEPNFFFTSVSNDRMRTNFIT